MFDIQSYQKAESVQDAVRLLAEDPEARLIAGGTDVLIKLREFEGFSRLVDIHDLPELKPITREADGTIRVGSGATFTDIEESPLVRACIPLLGEAAASVAGPQIRNVGTIGGNLCNGAVSALISFLRLFLFRGGMVILLPLFLKLDGIWLAVVVADALGALIAVLLIWIYRKRYGY